MKQSLKKTYLNSTLANQMCRYKHLYRKPLNLVTSCTTHQVGTHTIVKLAAKSSSLQQSIMPFHTSGPIRKQGVIEANNRRKVFTLCVMRELRDRSQSTAGSWDDGDNIITLCGHSVLLCVLVFMRCERMEVRCRMDVRKMGMLGAC